MAPVLKTLNTMARINPATLASRAIRRRLPIAVLTSSIGKATRQIPIKESSPCGSSVPTVRCIGKGKITEFCLCCITVPIPNTASVFKSLLHLWAFEVVVHRSQCLSISFCIAPDSSVSADEGQSSLLRLSKSIDKRIYCIVSKVIFGGGVFSMRNSRVNAA